jgi:predicted transcriptional regulator
MQEIINNPEIKKRRENMNAICMSIRPEHLVNILNFKKTIEVRKRFPIGYRGWVNLYCTKDKENLLFDTSYGKDDMRSYTFYCRGKNKEDEQDVLLNGKVVARFFVDNVEEIIVDCYHRCYTSTLTPSELHHMSCLSSTDLYHYCFFYNYCPSAYAIHIAKLEIFDNPKTLADFDLEKAPQSWCYVEEK